MDKIGKYEVLEKIGTGGFGVVFKAYDPFIKRLVAIKTCTANDEDIRQRFFQEAEIAGNLQHRNVVTVYDFGVQGEVPYLIQEYLTGEDLDRKIKRREPMPHRERLLFLMQIARGLEYAHSRGVIHRDIKPANIRILEDGTAKIMDFGIAKLAQRQSGLTQTGMTLGTAAYLAPEQIRGEPVDQRTDIFSLGVLAYELLTFERPFSGEVISTVLYQILNSKPRAIAEMWPDSPSDFVAVIERCLQKDPNRRYANCGELIKDLDVVLRRMRASAARSLADTGPAETVAHTSAIGTTRSGSLPIPSDSTVATTSGSTQQVQAADNEFDLSFDRYRRTPRSISTSAAYREKEVSKLSWVAAGAAVIILLGVGGWYWQGRDVPASSASTGTVAPASPLATSPASSPVNAPPTAPPTASPAPANPNGGAAVPAPVIVTPPAPKPPEKATLTVPAAWDPETTVTVDDGAAHTLDRNLSLSLAPGRHLLIFELSSADYNARSEVKLEAKPGEKLQQASPIGRPGRVTVQSALSSPVGSIQVDRENWGFSPVTNRALSPGSHQVVIRAQRPEAVGSRSFQVPLVVASDHVYTITFNLLKEGEPLVYDSPPNP